MLLACLLASNPKKKEKGKEKKNRRMDDLRGCGIKRPPTRQQSKGTDW